MNIAELGVLTDKIPPVAKAAVSFTRPLKNNPREIIEVDMHSIY
jgi:alcohol dehydrogenase class IV